MVNDKRVGTITAFPRFSIGLSSQNSLYGAAGSKFPHRNRRHQPCRPYTQHHGILLRRVESQLPSTVNTDNSNQHLKLK